MSVQLKNAVKRAKLLLQERHYRETHKPQLVIRKAGSQVPVLPTDKPQLYIRLS